MLIVYFIGQKTVGRAETFSFCPYDPIYCVGISAKDRAQGT